MWALHGSLDSGHEVTEKKLASAADLRALVRAASTPELAE